VLFGPCRVRFREREGIRDVVVGHGEVYRFTIPPGVSHAFKNTGTQPSAMVALSTSVDGDSESKTVKDVLID
jgi:mannose-6-phosphate isomerase-like protein (cupin superfamily)